MSVLVIADNKKAFFNYHIIETFEAGLELKGSEVKSVRDRNVQFKDSYISFKSHEAFWQNAHISVYNASSYNNHEPERLRKLLLHKSELEKISTALREKGLTCIPLKIYLKNGRVKLSIGLAKGKKAPDKRESINKKEAEREMSRQRRQYCHSLFFS